MIWESYYQLYQLYLVSLAQGRILALAAEEVLKDFPQRLPRDLAHPMMAGLAKMLATVLEAYGIPTEDIESALRPLLTGDGDGETEAPTPSDLLEPAITMYLALAALPAEVRDIEFTYQLRSQELVMNIARLDAFVSDSIRTICRACPQVLASEREIQWNVALSLGGWNELIEHMTEKFIYDLGWSPLTKRIAFMREKIGLDFDLPSEEARLLDEASAGRNLAVHRGGRVDQNFIARIGREDLKVGGRLPLNTEFMQNLYSVCETLPGELLAAVARKFFGKADSELPTVWRRGTHPWERTRLH